MANNTSLDVYGPDSHGAPHYIPGGYWAVCQRCEMKRRRYDVAREWTGLFVCKDTCWDPRPPDMTPPKVWPEGVPVPYPLPEPPNIFVDVPPPYSD